MDIIIVDDELVSLTVLKQLVGKLPDCRVHAFTHPSAALAWCKPNEPDVVIVDYMMPDLNGIEFTRQLCALEGRADTPMMMVSASADRSVRYSALRSGFNGFMNKPFDFSELQSRVRDMVFLRSSQKQLVNRAFLLSGANLDAASLLASAGGTIRLLNVEMTLARLAGDEALLAAVARVFLHTVPQILTALDAAISSSDFERASVQAHALKGAVAPFEAPAVFNAVSDVETQARVRNAEGLSVAFSTAQNLVEGLLDELGHMPLRSIDPAPEV
jgi:CheY-like chemotaxis protein